MKKWMTCLILGAMLTGLIACGDAEPAEPSAGGEAAPVQEAAAAEEEADVPEETENPAEIDELPSTKDYEGYTFTVLSHELPDSSIAWKVVDIYTTKNEDSASKGAMTLTCRAGGVEISVRTTVLVDEKGQLITEEAYAGKTIDVRGIVDYYNGGYQIKVFSANSIIVH